ncbi:MAG: ATP-binding cassette domain-containing protein [Eubacteriaceae bacterium]|nr:ATP-binding cassette domain-containing protein [Eubacteriaceae bacterium]
MPSDGKEIMLAIINSVSKSYGSNTILKNVSASVDEGARIGLIGSNGAGKSTLAAIICSLVPIDEGSVWLREGAKAVYLAQDTGLSGSMGLYSAVLAGFAELEAKQEGLDQIIARMSSETDVAKLEKLSARFSALLEEFENNSGFYYKELAASSLKGLGFLESDFSTPISNLSGGQKMRAALAKALLSKPALLVLDEPTNYLDAESMLWLEGALNNFTGAYIAISHDRYFLDKAARAIWLIEGGVLKTYKGNYSQSLALRNEEESAQAKAYRLAVEEIKRQKAIIAKLKSFNREKSVRAAESREKKLAKMDMPEQPKAASIAKVALARAGNSSPTPLRLKDICIGYSKDKPLIQGLSLEAKAGQKIGIAGRNATGKTTLFKTIMGMLEPLSGSVELNGPKDNIMYLSQEHEGLDLSATALEELERFSGRNQAEIRNILASLELTGEEGLKRISEMSGGERARVDIAKLMLSSHGILLLDEPTNHLDIALREVFESAIISYEGAALIISHDRYLLNKVANRMVFLRDGKPSIYNLGYEEAFAEFTDSQKPSGDPVSAGEGRNQERPPKQKNSASKNEIYRAEKRIAELDTLLEEAQSSISQLESELGTAELYKDHSLAQQRLAKLDSLKSCYGELEEEWLSLSYFLEGAKNDA